MFDSVLRPVKDRVLAPLAARLGWVSPTALTLLSLGVGLAAAFAGWRGAFGWGLALWVLNRILDGLDGAVARVHDRVSDLGGYFDLVADFTVYAAVPLGLALRPGADPALAAWAAVLLGAFYVNTISWTVPAALLEKREAGAGAREAPTSVVIPEGLISGGETVLFYSLFFALPDQQVVLFAVMAALTLVTVLQRAVWAARTFRSP